MDIQLGMHSGSFLVMTSVTFGNQLYTTVYLGPVKAPSWLLVNKELLLTLQTLFLVID